MSEVTRFKVDNLMLLVGSNPLPNYVAAQVLAKDPATTRIILVCSHDTRDEAAKRLTKLLNEQGFAAIAHYEVDEADPEQIHREVANVVRSLSGTIGLDYTGGTKAMSVHAYQAVKDTAHHRAQYIYLDARSLSMKISSAMIVGGTTQTLAKVGQYLPSGALTIKRLLALHDLNALKQEMQTEARWPEAAHLLAELHTDAARAQAWREWCNKALRAPDKRHRLQLKERNQLVDVTLADIPDDAVKQTFIALHPDFGSSTTFKALGEHFQIKSDSKSLAKWFDGEWLESYILHTLQPLQATGFVDELVMTIEPKLVHQDQTFEFDVAALRGYQLFAFSATTISGKGDLKPKLLEAITRSRQMGGDEARVALVCCAIPGDVQNLEAEIATLFRQRTLTKVFGRDDLLDLREKVESWILDVEAGRA
jgi:hypothetical protein